MYLKCLRCSTALQNDYQLIFDETGIELQLDKLLAEHFDIFITKDANKIQGLCETCVNDLIEVYDLTQKYKKETSEMPVTEVNIIKNELDDYNRQVKEEEAIDIIEEIDGEPAELDDIEIIEESNSYSDNEQFFGFKESDEYVENLDDNDTNLVDLNIKEYLQDVIKTDLEEISFDQNSDCKLCGATLNSHSDVLMHASNHAIESDQFPCIFCEEIESFESIKILAQHIVLKHYDLNTITIYCLCIECNKRFSSFVEYNKHSCYKQIVGSRLLQQCETCRKKFSSNKRYRFHLQFHLDKRRPKACFICDVLFADENDFFEHIMYSHEESEFTCIKCDRVCTTKELYDTHIKLHNALRSFHCSYCSKSYLHNQMLTNHIQQHHTDNKSNRCNICNKSLASKHLLAKHMQTRHIVETEDDVFVCLTCGLLGHAEDDVKIHAEEDKCQGAEVGNERLKIAYACEFCELAYNSVENLKNHRVIHSDNEYKCWICESKYSTYKSLKTHIQTHSTYEPIQKLFPVNRHYVCNFESCDKSYLSWPSLRAHRTEHTTKLKCEICDKVFKTQSKLHNHFKSHNDNNEEFQCQFCPKMCVSQMSLAVHTARKHNHNYKSCPTCKATCSTDEALKEHMELNHVQMKCEQCGKITKNKRNLELHTQMIHSKVKRFFCSTCNKGYFNNSDLKVHERVAHVEVNKFKCNLCNFSSSYEASYNVHLLSHDQKKPYKCGECSREFTRKSCYNLHLLRHSDVKPFSCPVEDCGRSFVMRGILNSHLKDAHPEFLGESKAKKASPRPTKRRKLNTKANKPETEASVSYNNSVIVEELSQNGFLEVDDGEGGIVMFDGTNAEEEIVLECSEEGEFYIN